jgi:hypothetical protein
MNIPGQILRSVSVWNVPKTTALWNSDYNDYRSHTEKFSDSDYDFEDATTTLHKGILYSFENSVTGSYTNDNFTTCLIVGIEAEGSNGRVTYYRLNVHESGAQLLKRNYVYQITITRVLGLGANTEHDAYTGANTLLDVNVRNWQDGGQGGVMFDGEDILAIGANRIDFTGNGGEESVTIFTFSPDPGKTLQVTGNDLPAGIRIVSLANNTLTVEADPTNVARGGFIELTFGTMRGTVQVAQSDRQNLYLDLSVGITEIPPFDKGSATEMDGNVKVTSSGPWTAELHNGKFEFSSHPPYFSRPGVLQITGINGDTFTLATLDALVQPESHFAFVIVSLDADPDINRVLVLQQEGTAYIELIDRSDANLVFTPNGQPTPENALTPGVHKVYINGSTDWKFSISGQASSLFEVVDDEVKNDVNGDYILIRAKGVNPLAFDGEAVITAYLEIDPSVRVTINLLQQAHRISFAPVTVPNVAVAGGTTQPITVTSTADFTVTIAMQAGSYPVAATLSDPPATQSGQGFRVTFPMIPMGSFGVMPVAIVTATINGTNVSTSMSIQQGSRTPRNIRIVNAAATWYSLGPAGTAANRNFSARLAAELASNANFGPVSPPATVFSGAREFVAAVNLNPAAPAANADVFNFNDLATSAAVGTTIRNWLRQSEYRVLIMSGRTLWLGMNNLGMGYTARVGGNNGNHVIAPAVRPGNGPGINPSSSRLAAYLFRDGPFTNGTDISDRVSLRPNDATGIVLSGFPSSYINIIPHPTTPNWSVFGIDPVNRVIFMGNSLFGTTSDWSNQANVQFVQNLAAWIIENTQYGKTFNDWFSGPPTIP